MLRCLLEFPCGFSLKSEAAKPLYKNTRLRDLRFRYLFAAFPALTLGCRARQGELCSIQDGQTRRLQKQLDPFVNLLTDSSGYKPKSCHQKISVEYVTDFRRQSEYFYFTVSHSFSTMITSGFYRETEVQGEINEVNRYARTTRRRRQMNDFWKLENLGIPSDAARQIREQHEKELAAERDARRQNPVRDVRDAKGQTPRTTDCLRSLSSLRV